MNAGPDGSSPVRARLRLKGVIQGVGFRPYLARLARDLSLTGWARNEPGGLVAEAQGASNALEHFIQRAAAGPAPEWSGARVSSIERIMIPLVVDERSFEILASELESKAGDESRRRISVPPDCAICPECRAEMLDAHNRRADHPFITCCHCGPRFTMLLDLPYDRATTMMSHFEMCPACRAEYESISDCRFHAESICCPDCGPGLKWISQSAEEVGRGAPRLESDHAALDAAARALECGGIIAMKGLGGFHLLARADDASAARRLRELKRREARPFAVMFPDLETLENYAMVTPREREALTSPQAPIVLVESRCATLGKAGWATPLGLEDRGGLTQDIASLNPGLTSATPLGSSRAEFDLEPPQGRLDGANLKSSGCATLAPAIAPGANRWIGAMLPYSSAHLLLMRRVGRPLIATSANRSGEPIITDYKALVAAFDLGPELNGVLDHDRPIARAADDSVMRIIDGAPAIVRVGRGFALIEIEAPRGICGAVEGDILALGGHEKVTPALLRDGVVYVGAHAGDMDTVPRRRAYAAAVEDLLKLFASRPSVIAHDTHPDYFTTGLARELADRFDARTHPVQHHAAHLFSAALDAGRAADEILAVCWDGSGLGPDGTIWGGEFLAIDAASVFARAGRIRPFNLPGGEVAIREPWRVGLALAISADMDPEMLFRAPDPSGYQPDANAIKGLSRAVSLGNTVRPLCSSVGRLFDGAASLLGVRHRALYQAQPAIELESIAGDQDGGDVTPCKINICSDGAIEIDWRPLVRELVCGSSGGAPLARLAARFHESLADAIARVCVETAGRRAVALTGGCMQNKRLVESAAARLRAAGIEVLLHRRLPPNDEGLSAGQAFATAWRSSRMAAPPLTMPSRTEDR